jgi:hypothetical protein
MREQVHACFMRAGALTLIPLDRKEAHREPLTSEGKTMTRKHCPQGAPHSRNLRGRTLYLVDIENMVGSNEPTCGQVAQTQRRICTAIQPCAGDHTVIAASHHNALAMIYGWTGSAQRKMRSGIDGADLALLESLEDIPWVAARYQRVVIASGDHAFAFAVASLRAAGVEVVVIRPDRGLSSAIRRAAGPNVVPLGSALPINVHALFAHTKDAA